MFKLTKNLPIHGGVGFLRFRREDLTRMEGKIQGGLRPPSELCISGNPKDSLNSPFAI